jgi:hypothetical protein
VPPPFLEAPNCVKRVATDRPLRLLAADLASTVAVAFHQRLRTSSANTTLEAQCPTDLYFGPVAPAGKEGQWIKTNPDSGWFVNLRLYGPDGPAFDGRWKPGDFEEIAPASIGRALQQRGR